MMGIQSGMGKGVEDALRFGGQPFEGCGIVRPRTLYRLGVSQTLGNDLCHVS